MADYAPYASSTEAIEEYKALRSEILESQKQRVTLVQVSLAAVVGLLTYFLRDDSVSSLEALLLVVVNTTATLWTYSTRVRERRIANFIETFLRPVSVWSRISTKESRLSVFQRSSAAMSLIFALLSALFATLAFPGWPSPQSTLDWVWLTVIGLSIIQGLLFWKTIRLPDFKPALRRARAEMIDSDALRDTSTSVPHGEPPNRLRETAVEQDHARL